MSEHRHGDAPLPWRITRLPDGGCSFGGRILRVGESVEVVPAVACDGAVAALTTIRNALRDWTDGGVADLGPDEVFKVADDALNHLGSATEPIEVVRVEQLAEIIEEAAERIFASGILDEIAASDDGFGRDAMQDAVTIARLAYRGR